MIDGTTKGLFRMKRLLPLVFLALLASCGGTPNEDTYVVKWATPTGAPTLAFYPEAENENWFSSATPATQVLPHFGDNAYDALVFDGTQALTNIKVNNRNYALAKWISGGTFYVVSTKYQATDTAPENPKVMAFMKQGNISKAFRDLAKNKWGWGEYPADTSNTVFYGDAVSAVQGQLASMLSAGSVADDPYDYYLVADPVYSAMMAQFKKANLPLYSVYDMQSEFKALHAGADIPAAAIFVNKDSYAAHPAAIDSWLAGVQANINVVASNLDPVIEEVKKSDSEDGKSNARFGISSAALTIVKKRAGTDQNPMNYHASAEGWTKEQNLAYANSFQTALGESAFEEACFL